MTDVTLVEGKLAFAFSGVRYAEQYDNWAHYRKQFQPTCGGSKAMDFIIVVQSTVWLIEVKDYRQLPRTNPTDLADEVAQKVRDTMAGLFSAKFLANDSDERNVADAALASQKIRVGVHLEQPKKLSRLFPQAIDPAKFLLKLKSRVRFADHHPKVFDSRSIPTALQLVVTAK